MDVLQEFQFYDKFSRYNWNLMRRERWDETVDRAVNYLIELGGNESKINYEEIRDFMFNMKAMSSMRLLAMAGEAARRNNIAIYNCSACGVDSIDSFVEAMVISMAGCGVGFSVERRFVDKLPKISERTGLVFSHVVDDSAEGWAEALRFGIENFFAGNDVVFDYSLLRPAGAILRTKGGRSSGPHALKECIDFCRNVIFSAAGRKLKPIEVHDMMCSIGQCAVSGGVRRTAMISIFDFDDTEMMKAKKGNFNPVRWNANNSIALPHDISKDEFYDFFMSMHESRNGEPGIFNRRAVFKTIPERRKRDGYVFLPNPCQPGFATVLTPDGIRAFDDIDVGSVIYDGKKWTEVVRKVYTGVKPVYAYYTPYGFFVGTEDHRVISHSIKVPVKNADKIKTSTGPICVGKIDRDSVFAGFAFSGFSENNNCQYVRINSGCIEDFRLLFPAIYVSSTGKIRYDGPRPEELINRYKFERPDKVISFLRGVFSNAASVLRPGNLYVCVTATIKEDYIRDIQLMLSSVGIASKVDGNKLKIRAQANDFVNTIGFIDLKRNKLALNNLARKGVFDYGEVIRVEYLGDFDVYDITVSSDAHVYWSGGLLVSNCGEIVLREDGELCNLSMAIARYDDTIESLADKVRVATIIGTIQSLATHFPGLRNTWKDNAIEERLLGVDICGHYDCPLLDSPKVLEYLRSVAINTNKFYSKILGINQSAAVTCVKPSGNSSLLFDVSPGIHPRWSKYYIRNVRVMATSPLYRLLRDQGAPMSPENGQTAENATTWVVHFPVKAPENAVTVDDVTSIEHFRRWLMVKKYYTEHNPSATIVYKDDELPELIDEIWKNIDYVAGLTFLPYSDIKYEQMPIEKITKEEYEKLLSDFPKIDFSKLPDYETEDMTSAAQELSCFGGACLI